MIKHAEKVESYFGYWPLFCDAKVIDFKLSNLGIFMLTVCYIDVDKKMEAKINIKFSRVSDMNFSELRSENVINELRIPETLPGKVVLDACFGVHGHFICNTVEVLSITPNPSFQRAAFGSH